MNIEDLKKQFSLVQFSRVDYCINQRNEEAFYPFGAPKPEKINGHFIPMVNVKGGADTALAINEAAIIKLAEWHQKRGEAIKND